MIRAIVTGASGALGEAIVRRLASDGLHVIAHAHRKLDACVALADELCAQGASVEAVAFDVRDTAQSEQVLERLLEAGPIQVIVNNAGIHDDAVLAGMNQRQWHDVISVTLDGFYNVTKPLLMPMIRTRFGRVISISSIAGVIGNRGQVNYAAAKSGLHGATRALALEVASRGITANVVAPGIIESPMITRAFSDEAIERLVPMKRAGRPDEVAALVAFLAGTDAGYISGQVIGINGAMG